MLLVPGELIERSHAVALHWQPVLVACMPDLIWPHSPSFEPQGSPYHVGGALPGPRQCPIDLGVVVA